jgi:hypothetical protein
MDKMDKIGTIEAIDKTAIAPAPVREPLHHAGTWSPVQQQELGAGGVFRLDGDQRWRVMRCQQGVIWVTQERDLQDYVLTAGETFIITQPGRVVVQALEDATIEITAPLKTAPYAGNYVFFP